MRYYAQKIVAALNDICDFINEKYADEMWETKLLRAANYLDRLEVDYVRSYEFTDQLWIYDMKDAFCRRIRIQAHNSASSGNWLKAPNEWMLNNVFSRKDGEKMRRLGNNFINK